MEKIPCKPEMVNKCRVFLSEGKCRQDVHHEYFPKSEYQTPVEKEFRELEINKQFICRALHNAIHAKKRRSGKPSRETMRRAIND